MAIIEFINNKNETLLGMKRNIEYILEDEKTENKKYAYGQNCDIGNAYEDFILTKRVHQKAIGRQHIHFTQSFRRKEASYELAHEIGKRLLDHPTFAGFQVVMATHTDTENVHNHFVINTVNMENGQKWKLSKKELQEIKDISDELCMEHGLSIVDETYKTTKEYTPIWKKNSIQYRTYEVLLNAVKIAKNERELSELLKGSRVKLYWEEKKDFSKNETLEKILNACKYHALNEKEFIEDLKHHGVDICWRVQATVQEITEDGEIVKVEKDFDSVNEYKAYVEELKEQEDVLYYKDDITFLYEGETYTPAHFLKNMRYEGKMLREQFEVNYVKDNQKLLPPKDELRKGKGSDEFKNMTQMIKVARQCSQSREEFIKKMAALGVAIKWGDNRKYITFGKEEIKKDGTKKFIPLYRNRSFFPRSSFTKEAFEQVFVFNAAMMEIIKNHAINTYEDLQGLAKSGDVPGVRLDEQTGRVHLKMQFWVDKKPDKRAEKGVNEKVEMETAERESYFDKAAVERFLAGKERGDIVLPPKEEIIKQEDKLVLLETEEGYLFSSTNLSKHFTKEKLENIFLGNRFREEKAAIYQDIRSTLYCSYDRSDFEEKLSMLGYELKDETVTGEERKILLSSGRKKGENVLLFTKGDDLRFESTKLWKRLTAEYLEECFAQNREREGKKAMEEQFALYLNGVWFLQSLEENEVTEDEKAPKKGKLEGQALRDYLKEKGVEL